MERLSKALSGEVERAYDMVIAVVGRGFSDYVVSAARDAGATGATIINGRGTSDEDEQVMGILIQPEREVVLVIVKHEERKKIMKAIVDKTSVIEEGRGVCFSMPIAGQVFGLARAEKDKKAQMRKAMALEKKTAKKKGKSL